MMQYSQEASADVEEAVKNLQHVSDEQLKRLIEDDSAFDEYFKNLSQVTFLLTYTFLILFVLLVILENYLSWAKKIIIKKKTLNETFFEGKKVGSWEGHADGQ